MVLMWSLALVPILFAFGCARQPSAEDLYRESVALWKRGFFQQALSKADRGWRQWESQPNAEWHWKFRLLEAELLLNPLSPARSLALLEGLSGAPPSGELKARYLADLGFARKNSALLDQSLALASSEGYSSLAAGIELKRASLDGYTARSESFLRNALSQAVAQKDRYLEASALLDLGLVRLNASRFDEAIPWEERAESLARAIGADRLQWEAKAGLAKLLHAARRDSEADSEYRGALATIEDQWSSLGEDRHKVTFLAQLIRFYGDYVDFLAGLGQSERAAAVADSSRARVLAEKLGKDPHAGQAGLRPVKSGLILLSYWLGPDRSYLWLTGPRGVSQFILPGETRIADLVQLYSAAIERGHDPLQRDNPAGRLLFETLIAPARALIPAQAKVIIVPDGSLHGLNFETLIVPDPVPHYWIEDVTLAVAPAIGLLQQAPARVAGRLLLISDPAAADPDFPPLPHLKQEAEIIGRALPSLTPLTGQQASPPAYRAAHPGDYSLIHFAAHAVANAESPLNSAIILAKAGEEYKLYAKDLIDQRLTAELVTISACHSAGAKSYSGEGLFGFTWAFLQAGARNVVAGLWNADDAATAELMSTFYRQLAKGAAPAPALRLAKLKLLESAGQNRRPYYWGAFQVFTRQW